MDDETEVDQKLGEEEKYIKQIELKKVEKDYVFYVVNHDDKAEERDYE